MKIIAARVCVARSWPPAEAPRRLVQGRSATASFSGELALVIGSTRVQLARRALPVHGRRGAGRDVAGSDILVCGAGANLRVLP